MLAVLFHVVARHRSEEQGRTRPTPLRHEKTNCVYASCVVSLCVCTTVLKIARPNYPSPDRESKAELSVCVFFCFVLFARSRSEEQHRTSPAPLRRATPNYMYVCRVVLLCLFVFFLPNLVQRNNCVANSCSLFISLSFISYHNDCNRKGY